MGASPNNKLTERAAMALEWLNTPEKKIARLEKKLELEGHPLRGLHQQLRSVLRFGPLFVPRHQVQLLAKIRKREQKENRTWHLTQDKIEDLVSYLQKRLPHVPHHYIMTKERGVRLVPDFDALNDQGKILHAFGALIEDLGSKGPHRLKRCQWEDCDRFIWDPTNAGTKKFCPQIHDLARALDRQKKSR